MLESLHSVIVEVMTPIYENSPGTRSTRQGHFDIT